MNFKAQIHTKEFIHFFSFESINLLEIGIFWLKYFSERICVNYFWSWYQGPLSDSI